MAEMNTQPVDLKPDRLDTYKVWQAEQQIPCIRGFLSRTSTKFPWSLGI